MSGDGSPSRRGASWGRRLLWSVAGVAAVLVISFTMFGFPEVGPGTEGTSGGAQRYVGKQLSAKDVKVADTDVQRFIQSDTFDRLIRNDVTRKALVKAFSDPMLAAALQNQKLVAALQDEEVRETLSNPQILKALSNPDFRKHFADLELAAALAGEDEIFASLATLELQKAIKNKHLLDAMQLTDVEELLANEADGVAPEEAAHRRDARRRARRGSLRRAGQVAEEPGRHRGAAGSRASKLALNEPVIEAALAKGSGLQVAMQEPKSPPRSRSTPASRAASRTWRSSRRCPTTTSGTRSRTTASARRCSTRTSSWRCRTIKSSRRCTIPRSR